MGRLENLKQRHDKLSSNVGIGAGAGGRPPRRGGLVVKVAPGVVILAALLLGGLVWLRHRSGGADDALAAAGERYRHAVGLVVAAIRDENGVEHVIPLATAWGYRPGLAATNAHVAVQARELAEAGANVAIVVNGLPDSRLPVVGAIVHDRYLGADGRLPQASRASDSGPEVYDVALLLLDGDFPIHFPLADAAELSRVGAGYRVAYVGFPMENLARGNVDARNPVATMQSGIVTAATDFEQRDAGASGNVLLRHNLGVTGGASGSPLFNARGRVVGIVNGMNITAQVLPGADGRPELVRAPSAAMINFAQRADLLDELAATAARQ